MDSDKKYKSLISKCKSTINDYSGIEIVDRNWVLGKNIQEYIHDNKLAANKEMELVKCLSRDLASSQIESFIRFYKTYPNFIRKRKKLIWDTYTRLISLPPSERKVYEKMWIEGKIKDTTQFRRMLKERRESLR